MVFADEAQPQQQSNATWDYDAELWLIYGCLKVVVTLRLLFEAFAGIGFHDVLRIHPQKSNAPFQPRSTRLLI